MMSLRDTLPIKEEGADVDRAVRDGAKGEEGVETGYLDLNCATLRFTVAMSMA